jgi:hypothetical protein
LGPAEAVMAVGTGNPLLHVLHEWVKEYFPGLPPYEKKNGDFSGVGPADMVSQPPDWRKGPNKAGLKSRDCQSPAC